MSFRHPALTVRRALTVAAFAGMSVLAACGSDSTGPSGDSYKLYSIDAETLPITDTQAEGTAVLKSGTLSLGKSGTYTVRVSVTVTPTGGSASNHVFGENGTFVLDGATLTLTSTQDFVDGTLSESLGEVTVATKTATQITADVDNGDTTFSTWIFRK